MSIETKISMSSVEREGDTAYARDVINKFKEEGFLSDEEVQHALELVKEEGGKKAVDYVATIAEEKDPIRYSTLHK